jgi:hypothetical protein
MSKEAKASGSRKNFSLLNKARTKAIQMREKYKSFQNNLTSLT